MKNLDISTNFKNLSRQEFLVQVGGHMVAYHRQCLGKGTWLQLPSFLLFCDIQLKHTVDISEQSNFQMGFLL
jgi:hypothetical protein